jgi:hypothetical protein
MFSVKSGHILLPFLTVALHESDTRNPLLGRRLNNTEVNLITFINTQNHTIARKTVIIVLISEHVIA